MVQFLSPSLDVMLIIDLSGDPSQCSTILAIEQSDSKLKENNDQTLSEIFLYRNMLST